MPPPFSPVHSHIWYWSFTHVMVLYVTTVIPLPSLNRIFDILDNCFGTYPHVYACSICNIIVTSYIDPPPYRGDIHVYSYPARMRRGKAIGLSVCRCRCRHRQQENHQILHSRYLYVLQAQPISRYRWKTGLYALRIAQKDLLVLQIVHFLFSMPVVYRPHPLF